jgi:hypothetical protein
MRHISFILLLALLATGCSSPEKRARDAEMFSNYARGLGTLFGTIIDTASAGEARHVRITASGDNTFDISLNDFLLGTLNPNADNEAFWNTFAAQLPPAEKTDATGRTFTPPFHVVMYVTEDLPMKLVLQARDAARDAGAVEVVLGDDAPAPGDK